MRLVCFSVLDSFDSESMSQTHTDDVCKKDSLESMMSSLVAYVHKFEGANSEFAPFLSTLLLELDVS